MSDEAGEPAKGSVVLLRELFRKLEQIQAEQSRQGRRFDSLDRRFDDLSRLVLDQVRQGQRVERHLSELRDELELAIKAELSGRLGMLETELGHRFDDLANRMATLEGVDPWRAIEGPSSS